jgi:hypothetical protein
MTAPIRIQRRRAKGWKMPEGAVCVDRTTGFGNPFSIAKGTSTSMGKTDPIWMVGSFSGPAMWFRNTENEARDLSIDAYRVWIDQRPQDKLRLSATILLRGKDLACWCALDQPCHADVLLKLANAPLECGAA